MDGQMAVQIKICGITNPGDASEAARCGADYVGLICAPGARHITVDMAKQVMSVLPPPVQPVLLFRAAPLDEVVAALHATGCGWVQLHGHEPVAYLAQLVKRRPNLRVIKAWEVDSPPASDELLAYLHEAARADVTIDVVLLDAPKGGPHPGYERLGDISHRLRNRPPAVWCAGGLNPDNLSTAVASGRYDGVDVARGVESRPGVKDPAVLQRFLQIAKRL
jgi:phosphoribosylanthranilate isomerase